MIVVLFVVFDCAVKLLSLIMKSLALGSMDMVVVRQIDDGNRRLLNSCQRVNTGHKLLPMFDLSPPGESSHSVSHYDKSIIRKMGLLQDVNGFCPSMKASTIGMRGQKQGVV